MGFSIFDSVSFLFKFTFLFNKIHGLFDIKTSIPFKIKIIVELRNRNGKPIKKINFSCHPHFRKIKGFFSIFAKISFRCILKYCFKTFFSKIILRSYFSFQKCWDFLLFSLQQNCMPELIFSTFSILSSPLIAHLEKAKVNQVRYDLLFIEHMVYSRWALAFYWANLTLECLRVTKRSHIVKQTWRLF